MLFKSCPGVNFEPEVEICPDCQAPLNVYKTKFRKIFTMHIGGLDVKETLLKCNRCSNSVIYTSEELHNLVPEGSNYGYDVMTYIGEIMFSNHKQAGEIQALLQAQNIPISVSEVEHLGQRFVTYLSVTHEQNSTGIVEIMDENGGYMLHLDALGGTKGGERLISGLDGISDIVLGNAKIKSENSDYIIPFLENIRKLFGNPLVVVQDMGKGIMKAVETVFPCVLILICHFHFLRDIGKDLLGGNYDTIRKRLRHFGFLKNLRSLSKELKLLFDEQHESVDLFQESILSGRKADLNNSTDMAIFLYTIVEWVLDWKSKSNGYGFPFDRPHFDLASRINEVLKVIESIRITALISPEVNNILEQLKECFTKITQDSELQTAMDGIRGEILIFDELRSAMRVASENGNEGLNDNGEPEDIKHIEAEVDAFRIKMEAQQEFTQSKKGACFLKQINKYWKQLFADPIAVETPDGIKMILPQRTNNIMEQMFRDFTRDWMRKTGMNSIGRRIRSMVTDTPLIRNLKNAPYRKMIMRDKANLAEVFASIDVGMVRQRMKEQKISDEKIPSQIKNLLKQTNLPSLLSETTVV